MTENRENLQLVGIERYSLD